MNSQNASGGERRNQKLNLGPAKVVQRKNHISLLRTLDQGNIDKTRRHTHTQITWKFGGKFYCKHLCRKGGRRSRENDIVAAEAAAVTGGGGGRCCHACSKIVFWVFGG